MGKKSTPPPPDYVGAAEATARANRPNQYTPWGSSTWQEGRDGNWTQNIELSPQQQAALDDQMGITAERSNIAGGMLGRMGEEFGSPMDWDQFGEYTRDLSNGAETRNRVEDASYGRATSRLDPMWDKTMEAQEAQLRNQGLNPGDEAYENQMETMRNQKTDAYNQAMYSSILTGGQEASREQGMDLTAGTFGNTARQAQVSEEMQRRGFSLNEINALLSGQQIALPSMPQFRDGPDYSGAARDGYSAQMDQFNADQAGWNSLMGAAGSAFAFSDIRLKRNVRKVGTFKGNNYYIWTYIWGAPGFGVMAHEMPDEYLALHPSGFFMVDYGRL